MIETTLKEHIQTALSAVGIQDIEPQLEYPADLAHGDFATNMALVAAKTAGISPRELAEKIVAELGDIDGVEKIEIAGPGFINFHLSREYFSETVGRVDENWGKGNVFDNEVVLVEYTSPNLFKPLHIGNLVGNILGESVSRLLETQGASVKRINYPSDIGLTVAKGVWGLKKEQLDPKNILELGKAYVIGNKAYEAGGSDAEEIVAINKALFEGSDPELSRLREEGIATSLAHLNELCKRLGTTFDQEFYESQTGERGAEIVKEHTGSVYEKSDGAVVYKGEQDGLHTRVFLNSNNLPTYEAKEVGLFTYKYDAYPDFTKSITVTGAEQRDFFSVVFASLKKAFPKETEGKEFIHLANGFLTLTTGKMSSREGNVITGESLLNDVQESAFEKMGERVSSNKEDVARIVSVAAIKYTILKQSSGRNIVFDPEQALSFEGDSGPYLQYSYARAKSVLTKADAGQTQELAPELTPEFERILPRFPAVVARAAHEYEPHYVTTYLTELASGFNSWYANEKIIDSEHEAYKLALTRAFATTMKNGLELLGIEAPERM